jgi:lipopolysaccharide biosynthesis protein
MKLAIFIHYSEKNIVEEYVKFYLKNLHLYFDKIVIVTSSLNLTKNDFSEDNKIDLIYDEKNGYDFGKLYLALNSIEIDLYDRIGFFNDSSILFNNLDMIFDTIDTCNSDFIGLTDSMEIIPGYITENNYHLQSYFLIFNNRAISKLQQFFIDIDFVNFFKINLSPRDLRMKIIVECEIGLTQYMMSHRIKTYSIFKSEDIIVQYARDVKATNIHIILWKELIEMGYPFIKKKIVYDGFDPVLEKPYLPNFSQWKNIVAEYASEEFKNLNIL